MIRRTPVFRPSFKELPFGLADIALFFGLFLLIYGVAHVGRGFFVEFRPPNVQPAISLNPAMLPYYAARSTLRMFIALGVSLLFTFGYGYLAAKNKRAEQVMIPLLDILQSVPVLGFLTVTVTFFVALFPGSLLGLETASIFAAFTGQAWNMTFSFYHSLKAMPRELDEAAKIFQLSKWRRFVSVEIPTSMIGLVWNAMMSFGGGWFVVAFTEQVTVTKEHQYNLPGIGAYVQAATQTGNVPALTYASIAMILIIVIVDQFFWRPLVAWSEKFKMDRSSAAEAPQSWVLDLLRSAKVPKTLGRYLRRWQRQFRRIKWPSLPKLRKLEEYVPKRNKPSWINGDIVFGATLGAMIVGALWIGARFVRQEVATAEIAHAFALATFTFLRVMVLIALSTLIWTPIGVWIGFNPKWSRIAQPLVLLLASFPANFLFPIITIFFLAHHLNVDVFSIIPMALGTQWYVAFNVIAGAMAVPSDLREMTQNMGLRGWPRWKKLIIPAIFPAWVTGAITASGGAWNASILAEILKWKDQTLVANGIGAYVTQASDAQDVPRLVLGVTAMCIFVVGTNRLLWRRLYMLAETRYRLG